jgi:hypothetical protein
MLTRLRERRVPIVAQWHERILAGYAPDTAKFLASRKDRFANPVGDTLARAVTALFDELVGEVERGVSDGLLDELVHIRAVQDFSPSQALGFLPALKRVAREELGAFASDPAVASELAELDARVDELVLRAFDLYVRCREQVYEIRVKQFRNMTYNLVRRANLLVGEEPSGEPDGCQGS